ncbi:MAG: tRNA (N(6)-L-threonylcarbamoyladenosine(37)-C(2))-methylthiotransferase MtaB [Chlamydiales bacterium]|nr:tRNA (N(6)-L-threonylcarbamoyladenosine(37)-C(2))-methylthiotransferase MtaB [Chlamydiales bacterium]NCF70538.1 tRNA (N(6)-L-threonylcarbamoyladenosine(37)-C(2))-methylthiotransferase MtaB [Chlamydiales bacterium]
MSKKYRIMTLGCRTNQYESQAYRDQLHELGYSEAKEGEQAELCVLNSCTVTAQADKSSLQGVKQLIKKNPNAKVLVTGCATEGKGKKELIESLGEQVLVTLNKEKENLLKSAFATTDLPEFSIKQFEAHTRAFVKVQDGCNSFCSYCVIPYVRGRSRSRRLEPILEEVHALVANGYKDIVLTGINIGDFDGGVEKGEKSCNLAQLVREVDKIDGVKRLRISSIDPDEVDDDLVDAVLNGKNTCHSMHVVLQSGSNAILKRMNRKYTRQMFFDSIDYLKSKSPSFTFTTDVIVGFPGETEFDHQETLEAIEEVGFIKVHMFPYSKRERTKAALYTDHVDKPTVQRRKQEVLRRAEQVAFERQKEFLGKKVNVLIESKESDTKAFGHSENFLPVWVEKQGLRSNEMYSVELVENTPSGLIGRLI